MIWRLADLPAPPAGRKGWPWTIEPQLQPDEADGPAIAIVTPSFNQGRFIEETIRSVLLQGVPNVRYVIRDGGSTDETLAILEKYRPFCSEVVVKKDNGQSSVINEELLGASEPIACWLNSDDVFFPGTLAAVQEVWRKKPFTTLVGRSEYRTEDGTACFYRVDQPPARASDLFGYGRGVFVGQPSAYFSSETFKALGGLDESLRYTMDLDLWFRLFLSGRVRTSEHLMSFMRAHEAAKTSQGGEALLDEVESVFDRYDPDWRRKRPQDLRGMRRRRLTDRLEHPRFDIESLTEIGALLLQEPVFSVQKTSNLVRRRLSAAVRKIVPRPTPNSARTD